VPCKIFLKGDPEPLYANDPPDVVVDQLADRTPSNGSSVVTWSEQSRFVRLELAPYTRGDHTRACYLDPDGVAAILPVHPQEWEHLMDSTPSWLDG
jgi:hypothetical protein